eukprot:357773-Chlamydomonas_euryale.AAC.1
MGLGSAMATPCGLAHDAATRITPGQACLIIGHTDVAKSKLAFRDKEQSRTARPDPTSSCLPARRVGAGATARAA